ncbi:hypothetical protein AARAC_008683, partial [Aspergillus arachidicola]
DNQKRETWATPETDEDMADAVGLRMCTDRQCARLAKAPGMDIHAFTLHERPTPECKRDHSYVEAGIGDPNGDIPSRWCHGCDQLNEFLAGLDLLFRTLGKRNSFVGNVGRGPIVNTDDLVDALNNGTIRGAAVDVTDPEPLPAGHPLWKAKNVIITPHVGGNSTQYSESQWISFVLFKAPGRGFGNAFSSNTEVKSQMYDILEYISQNRLIMPASNYRLHQ